MKWWSEDKVKVMEVVCSGLPMGAEEVGTRIVQELATQTGHTIKVTLLQCAGMNHKTKMSVGKEKEPAGQME